MTSATRRCAEIATGAEIATLCTSGAVSLRWAGAVASVHEASTAASAKNASDRNPRQRRHAADPVPKSLHIIAY